MTPTIKAAFSTATALLVGFSAQAVNVFNNLGPGDSFDLVGRLLQGETVGTIANVDQAAAFTVGPANVVLTSLELALGVSGTGPLDVILAADNAGEPGAAIETISLNFDSTGETLALASSAGNLLLANTTYWVIADARGSFDGAWRFNNIGDIGLTAGRSAPVNSFAYGPWNVRPDDDRYALRVQGREVQVPDAGRTAVLLALGLGSLFALLKRVRGQA